MFYFFSIYTPVFLSSIISLHSYGLHSYTFWEDYHLLTANLAKCWDLSSGFLLLCGATHTLERVFKVSYEWKQNIQNFHYYHLSFSFLTKLPNSALEHYLQITVGLYWLDQNSTNASSHLLHLGYIVNIYQCCLFILQQLKSATLKSNPDLVRLWLFLFKHNCLKLPSMTLEHALASILPWS